MSQQSKRPQVPRAVIHKRILDAAADQPDASLNALASEIPAATADLVEKVLDDYGDPAGDELDEPPVLDPPKMAEEPNAVDIDDLSDAQRETLRAVAEDPDATQSELADTLGVSAPTVSNRVNDIEGFDWADREAFVETLFETRGPTIQEENTDENIQAGTIEGESNSNVHDQESKPMASNETKPVNSTGDEITMTKIAERVETLEKAVEDNLTAGGSEFVFDDADLMHKVIHACLKADTITEDEELRILKALLQ